MICKYILVRVQFWLYLVNGFYPHIKQQNANWINKRVWTFPTKILDLQISSLLIAIIFFFHRIIALALTLLIGGPQTSLPHFGHVVVDIPTPPFWKTKKSNYARRQSQKEPQHHHCQAATTLPPPRPVSNVPYIQLELA